MEESVEAPLRPFSALGATSSIGRGEPLCFLLQRTVRYDINELQHEGAADAITTLLKNVNVVAPNLLQAFSDMLRAPVVFAFPGTAIQQLRGSCICL